MTWNNNFTTKITISKNIIAFNFDDRIREDYLPKGRAIIKNIITDRYNRIRNNYFIKRRTAIVFASRYISICYILNGRKVI